MMIKWIKNLLCGEPCQHYNRKYRFKDIHRGDQWYVRGFVVCKDCKWKTVVAMPVPNTIDFSKMNLDSYYDEFRLGKYR